MENMKLWRITYALVTILLVNGVHTTARAQIAASLSSEPPAPAAVDCETLLFDMADCLTFLSKGVSDPKPSVPCCLGFQEVLNEDADCVCELIKKAGSFGLSMNVTKAVTLPSLCKISAPSIISSCNLSTAPVPSSGQSPANPPATNPPTTTPPTTTPPTTNPPADSPPSTPSKPPSAPPPTSNTPSAPTSPSPSSGSPKAHSPSAASVAPSPQKSSGTSTLPSTMPMFLVLSIMAVGSFLV